MFNEKSNKSAAVIPIADVVSSLFRCAICKFCTIAREKLLAPYVLSIIALFNSLDGINFDVWFLNEDDSFLKHG